MPAGDNTEWLPPMAGTGETIAKASKTVFAIAAPSVTQFDDMHCRPLCARPGFVTSAFSAAFCVPPRAAEWITYGGRAKRERIVPCETNVDATSVSPGGAQ